MNNTDKRRFNELWEALQFVYCYGTCERALIETIKKAFATFGPTRCQAGFKSYQYNYQKIEEAIGEVPCWFLICALCGAEFANYGTSPRYGWLERGGIEFFKYITTYSIEDLYKAVTDTDTDSIYEGS